LPIEKAFAYLIPPGKGVKAAPLIGSNEIALGSGKLMNMLEGIFAGSAGPHDFEITFNAQPDGTQENGCRSLLIDFQEKPVISAGLPVAQRLQRATDNRSGIGLLFLLAGDHGLKKRVIASRFPTDQAVLADLSAGGLNVEFLEQVFIKRLSSYKALLVEHQSPKDGFWKGIATDRQAGQSGEHISEYWLKEFLNADFSETPAAGTRRLARALKEAVKANPSISVKTEIAHASSLAPTALAGKSLTISEFCDHFGLSVAARDTIQSQLAKPSLFGKKFKFDPSEFRSVAPYRTVELNTGAILTAPSESFEEVFESKSDGENVEFRARGRVSDQRLARR
jgi:hypothetical protein